MRDIVAAACGCDARHGLQHEELVVLRLLVAIGACGFLQLGFAIIIPHFTTGLLGLLVSLCCIVFSLEIWHNRRVAYLMFGVMQPLPLVIIAYIDYAMLVKCTKLLCTLPHCTRTSYRPLASIAATRP